MEQFVNVEGQSAEDDNDKSIKGGGNSLSVLSVPLHYLPVFLSRTHFRFCLSQVVVSELYSFWLKRSKVWSDEKIFDIVRICVWP